MKHQAVVFTAVVLDDVDDGHAFEAQRRQVILVGGVGIGAALLVPALGQRPFGGHPAIAVAFGVCQDADGVAVHLEIDAARLAAGNDFAFQMGKDVFLHVVKGGL